MRKALCYYYWISLLCVFFTGNSFCLIVFVVAKVEVDGDAVGQEGAKKKRNRKRNKAKGWFIAVDVGWHIL